MSRFFVGQKVRVVGCEDNDRRWVVGAEGVVNELNCENEWAVSGYVGVTIGGNEDWCFLPEHLSPASDSNQKTSWDECAWKPEHIREESCSPNS